MDSWLENKKLQKKKIFMDFLKKIRTNHQDE